MFTVSCTPASDPKTEDRARREGQQKIAAPEIPPLELRARLDAFQQRAVYAVDAAKVAELVEVFDLAEGDAASRASQVRARRSFSDEKAAARALSRFWSSTKTRACAPSLRSNSVNV